MKEEKVIMYDSPEAASVVVLTTESGEHYSKGWVSANRRFYSTESQARQDSATHTKCECGNVYKVGSYCEPCQIKRRREVYFKKPYTRHPSIK